MSGTYSTGTVTVTNGSPTVTGSGTAWVGVLHAGWLMKLPDGQHYTIATVDSATQVTLADNYQGSGASGAAYRAVPTGAVALDLQTSVDALISDYGDVKDNAGAGKFANGSNAEPSIRGASDQDTGINFNGTSNEMDFVTGGTRRGGFTSSGLEMNTPLIGTAAQASAADATAGRLLKTGAAATVLAGGMESRCTAGGTVNVITLSTGASLSSVPTGFAVRFRATGQNTGSCSINLDGNGAIACRTIKGDVLPAFYIRADVDTVAVYDGTVWVVHREPQSGSNANGDWTRSADGVQECWHNLDVTITSSSLGSATWTFPAAFSAAPNSPHCNATAAAYLSRGVSTTTTQATIGGARRDGSTVTAVLSTDVRAIGRWY